MNTYDGAGQSVASINALGFRSTSIYDNAGRNIASVDPLGNRSTQVYDAAGQGVAQINALGNRSTRIYDETGQMIASENSLGFRTSSVYDSVVQAIATVDALGNVSTSIYNGSGQQISTESPLGLRTSVTYDGAGRQVSSIDANGNVSTSVYDHANQMVASENALGQRTSTIYDAAGRTIALENPRGFRTTSVFDSRNLKTENIDPLGRITTSLYDVAGRQTVRLDGRGNATTFSYDLDNRNTGKAYPDGSMVTFSFDMVSNRIAMQDSTGNYSFQYTSRNQMESAVNPAGRIVTYAFDAIGSMSKLTDSAGRVMTYQYDDASRLKFIQEIDGGRTTFAYDAANRRVLKQLANGTRASYTYDSASRLIEHANLKSDDSVLSDFQFGYDNAGNRLTTLENTGDRVTWTYDSVYQLTGDDRSGTGAYQRSFEYDANGNRLVKVADGETTTSTFDGADQLSTSEDSSGITNYSYDDNGNQSLSATPKGERTTSTWGYENQVELVALPSGQLVTATYNADNRRVSKANDDGVINFNWDPANDNVLLETDETDAVTAEYTNVPVPFGEPLTQSRAGALSFYHFDGNYSSRQLTNASQTVTDVSIFTGHGEEVDRSGSIIMPFGYKGAVGYYTDSATSDIYVRARTYQPIIGTWLSMDPLGFVDGENLYRAFFVPNGTDPMGLIVTRQGCLKAIATAKKDPKYIAAIKELKRLGCPVPPIRCSNANDDCRGKSGYYDSSKPEIVLCFGNHVQVSTVVKTVFHELVHALDDCTGISWTCRERACTEIRANCMSGHCEDGSPFRGEMTREECIKSFAVESTNEDWRCNPSDKIVDEIFDQCFICSSCGSNPLPPRWPLPLPPKPRWPWDQLWDKPIEFPIRPIFIPTL